MAVTDFDTKTAIVVRDDLAVWQRLNVAAFLISGVVGTADSAIGQPYIDADDRAYLPLLVQPVLVMETDAPGLQRALERARNRNVAVAIYTSQMFSTGNDDENRAAVRAVSTADLDLVGIGLRAPHQDANAVLRDLRRHP